MPNNVMNLNGPVQLKGGTAAALNAANPLLAQREIAVEVDTGKIKVGNGINYWNDLPYSDSSSSSSTLNNGQIYMLVNHPVEWNPDIDDIDTIYLTLNEIMNPIQLTGLNAEVNS